MYVKKIGVLIEKKMERELLWNQIQNSQKKEWKLLKNN